MSATTLALTLSLLFPFQFPLQDEPAPTGGTMIVPHLEHALEPGRNTLWCLTIQLAWEKVPEWPKEWPKIRLPDDHPHQLAVALMDRQPVSEHDIDEASHVARGGEATPEFLKSLERELVRKFGPEARDLVSDLEPGPHCLAFSYLKKDLPFPREFHRFQRSLRFAGTRVNSFGVRPGSGEIREPGSPMRAEQVTIHDERSGDDFILELKSTSPDDQILLARVPSAGTLESTIASVLFRVDRGTPRTLKRDEWLQIPVLDLDVEHEFDELCPPLIAAEQWIRFRLDERGAKVESRALLPSGGLGANGIFVFDGPFLMLLKRREARAPYFALWVENTELMEPYRRRQ